MLGDDCCAVEEGPWLGRCAVSDVDEVARIRAQLDHPVVDADGHTVEFLPALLPYLDEEGVRGDALGMLGDSLGPASGMWGQLSPSERAARRATRPPWWAVPARNTRDYATATLPRLLHERLPELGIDYSIVYPSLGLVFPHLDDETARVGGCRALNRYHADAFAGLRDRLEPVAVVPMHTPDEAIAVLDHAVLELGMKAVMIASYVRRPIGFVADADPALAPWATWIDCFGLDSAYDYDPVWARCVELGVPVGTHSSTMGWDARRSISNYMYNHIGHFGAAGEALCKALFMGGVTRRFPSLRVAFLEGGVSWARSLYADLIGHWDKRNRDAVLAYDPASLDRAVFADLIGRYGHPSVGVDLSWGGMFAARGDGDLDEWAACAIDRPEDIRDQFLPNFFFGCEADDPTTTSAFDTEVNPFGARLAAMFGSDLGHWDVPDMREVLEEAYESVERGWLSPRDFRDFTFTNPVRFCTDANPTFFSGTSVESDVKRLV